VIKYFKDTRFKENLFNKKFYIWLLSSAKILQTHVTISRIWTNCNWKGRDKFCVFIFYLCFCSRNWYNVFNFRRLEGSEQKKR